MFLSYVSSFVDKEGNSKLLNEGTRSWSQWSTREGPQFESSCQEKAKSQSLFSADNLHRNELSRQVIESSEVSLSKTDGARNESISPCFKRQIDFLLWR